MKCFLESKRMPLCPYFLTASIGHPLEWTEITGNQVENSWRIDGQRAQKLYFFPHQKNAHAVAGSCTP
ncbi:hypothetical protein POPTR_005G232450v4 [Populus trichocarpa]|uniref:Uncharacterized protein n=1 Tax=Populus trichocarpa TaxID=3694 RepID=A0A3N7F6X8_POPTR|nr:hypothetical protein BDE02_05G197300 [Populus trichocarpa]RQO90978.1 hypothetical protein POPTR_005G232450v4 [Populus trichocarpa]RQO90979.1 hypothetical protein POPTR_005G232450v4 [Populus trichocarpa]RQO90980.1 hypothetical protein POPTR_005G232450v4 [Populus trichocarpa]